MAIYDCVHSKLDLKIKKGQTLYYTVTEQKIIIHMHRCISEPLQRLWCSELKILRNGS